MEEKSQMQRFSFSLLKQYSTDLRRSRKAMYLADILVVVSFFQKEMNKKLYLAHVLNFIVYKTLSGHYLLWASKQYCSVEVITAPHLKNAKSETHGYDCGVPCSGSCREQGLNLTIKGLFPLLKEVQKTSVCPLCLS